MPTSRQRERRDRLFTAAQQAVVMRGADVRLKDIADMAGLTSGAILYHYPDVQSLLLEANQAVIERFLDNRVKAIRGLASPAEKLVVTVAGGLPVNAEDADVKLLCALGGAASRYPAYAAMLTSLFDRQVAMYQVILDKGAATGDFDLQGDSQTIGRNIVALEDAYGYRMVARHGSINYAAAVELILSYARIATGHPLDLPAAAPRQGA